MYFYLKCIVYEKLLKPQQSLQITLYSARLSWACSEDSAITGVCIPWSRDLLDKLPSSQLVKKFAAIYRK
jgi:hypothetical protein